jgi:membrane protein DedA with SNARE-associated domain
MNSVTSWLAGLSGPVIYAVVAAMVFFEDALFFGFVLPGETAVVLGGVLANRHHGVSVYWLALAVVLAAIAGDSVGYEVGHHFGPKILSTRPLVRHQDRISAAQELIRRRGAVAVFLGRFIAFFRAMMPALAGVSHLPYSTFLLFNALGGLAWGVGFTLLGYFAGSAYTQVEHTAGQVLALVLAAIVVAALAAWHLRRRRAAGQGPGDTHSPDKP